MIRLENVVLPSPEQMAFVIQGMRNPFNSWDKSDSFITHIEDNETMQEADFEHFVGDNDLDLMRRLSKAGTDHRKYMRMMPVMVRITAPLYWWKEFDTYKVGTVSNSTSTMHKIHSKEFTLEDFSCGQICNLGNGLIGRDSHTMLKKTIETLNFWRMLFNYSGEERENWFNYNGYPFVLSKTECWWQIIQLLPSSYNQTRNVMLNYEVLANMYRSRKHHRLTEWRTFCEWIETLPYSELITGGGNSEKNR